MDQRLQSIQALIAAVPDFPHKGILFRDIFPLTRDPKVFEECIELMASTLHEQHPVIDVIVGLDARGFIFGPLISLKLGCSFVPIRKAGKLPGNTIKADYVLEYGKDTFEIQKNAIQSGQKVVIIDDLLATGGTLAAACKLLKSVGAEILECMVLIELLDLKGRDKIPEKVRSFLTYEGE